MTHRLKVAPEFWGDLYSGAKTFEIRKNDRDYQVGDFLELNAYDKSQDKFINTYKTLFFKVSCVFNAFGLQDGFVCLGLKQLKESE